MKKRKEVNFDHMRFLLISYAVGLSCFNMGIYYLEAFYNIHIKGTFLRR